MAGYTSRDPESKGATVSEPSEPQPDPRPPDVPEPAPSPDPVPTPQPPPGEPDPGPQGDDEHPLEGDYPDADDADAR